MTEDDAITSLRHLGLSKYEAEVLIALQKLTVSTARDIARITDVPRSQVYGTAETLEERGLLEVQQSDPIQYRAVALDEARARLRREFEQEQTQAFEFLETVQGTFSGHTEQQEAIWTIHGRETVADRVIQIVRDADEYVVHGFGSAVRDETVTDALVAQATSGVDVTVVSSDQKVVDAFQDTAVRAKRLPDDLPREDWNGGRILVADGDTVLLSVLGDEELPGIKKETAFWSSKTGFATVLVQLINGWFGTRLEL